MSKVKFEVDFELLEEMAEVINNCSWISAEGIAAYMKDCITGSDNYQPEQWSVDSMCVEGRARSHKGWTKA